MTSARTVMQAIRENRWLFALGVVGLIFLFVPLELLVTAGMRISPVGRVQEKTLRLFEMLKIALPILGGVFCALSALPAPRRNSIWSSVQSLAASPMALPAIVALALVVRAAWVLFFPTRPYADSEWYFRTATELASGHGFVHDLESRKPLVAWPVGYPAFLASIFFLTGPAQQAAWLANVLLSTLTIPLLYAVASRLFDPAVAMISAVLLALLPGLIVYMSLISTDTLFLFLTTACLCLTLTNSKERIAGLDLVAIALGILGGFAALVRPGGLVLAAVWPIVRWVRTRNLRQTAHWFAVLALATALTLTPWMVRNYLEFGEPVLIAANGGANFWIGNNPRATGAFMFPRDDSNPLLPLIGDDLAVDKLGYAAGLRFISENPMTALMLVPAKLFYLFNSNDFGLHWNRLSAVDNQQPGTGVSAFALTNLIYVVIAIFALIGSASALLAQERRASAVSLLVLSAVWTAVHLPYFGQDRFVLPLLPVLTIFAARGVQSVVGSVGTLSLARVNGSPP